jgi:hypothetical protein
MEQAWKKRKENCLVDSMFISWIKGWKKGTENCLGWLLTRENRKMQPCRFPSAFLRLCHECNPFLLSATALSFKWSCGCKVIKMRLSGDGRLAGNGDFEIVVVVVVDDE